MQHQALGYRVALGTILNLTFNDFHRLSPESSHRMRNSGAPGDRNDMGEHAASVPGWEGSYERRGAVELDAVLTGGLGPGQLAGVPLDEGFGFRRDVEVLFEAGVGLTDLSVSVLDE